jgi:putative ABC transport system permease protein
MYLPLISGAYISILILRFPDLTIEASWSMGAILACMVVKYFGVTPVGALFFGVFAGMVCGGLTGMLFVITGRAKLLAGLISYFILEAVGFHLLGRSARISLEHSACRFGYADGRYSSLLIYGLISVAAFVVVLAWQRSSVGIRSRIIGENAVASTFYGISLNIYFPMGLILSNAIIGLGGGLWGIYCGYASNTQGIGFLIKAFLALLIGDELLKLIRISKRTIPCAIGVGSFIFVLLSLGSEVLQLRIAEKVQYLWYKPTDKQFILAAILIGILWFRRGRTTREGRVSEW